MRGPIAPLGRRAGVAAELAAALLFGAGTPPAKALQRDSHIATAHEHEHAYGPRDPHHVHAAPVSGGRPDRHVHRPVTHGHPHHPDWHHRHRHR